MRNISFALTTEQIRNRTKTVTRRLAWKNLKPGTLLQPVIKSQGLKKGEKVQMIGGPIRVLSVRRERLFIRSADNGTADTRYGWQESAREGFLIEYGAFVDFFVKHNGGRPSQIVTRIEFEYVQPPLPADRTEKP